MDYIVLVIYWHCAREIAFILLETPILLMCAVCIDVWGIAPVQLVFIWLAEKENMYSYDMQKCVSVCFPWIGLNDWIILISSGVEVLLYWQILVHFVLAMPNVQHFYVSMCLVSNISPLEKVICVKKTYFPTPFEFTWGVCVYVGVCICVCIL